MNCSKLPKKEETPSEGTAYNNDNAQRRRHWQSDSTTAFKDMKS
jgi:hypothetical protein